MADLPGRSAELGYHRADFYHCYPGLYAPRTLDVQLDHAEAGVIGLLRELLALTKMNWSSTILSSMAQREREKITPGMARGLEGKVDRVDWRSAASGLRS
jgi:hypothetical protein